MRTLLAGNWKMNGLRASLAELRALARALSEERPTVDVLICPPATLVMEAAKACENTRIAVGGQDCHAAPWGAFTGDISADMLRDAGATHVIVGHSERRFYHRETDAMVALKVNAARRAGLAAIVCVGETEAVRDAGNAVETVTAQLTDSLPAEAVPSALTVAYEPVWAIGTGRTAEPPQILEMHKALRETLKNRFGTEGAGIRILYGGSVKPANAGEILSLADVNGALVGGASLKAADFLAIVRAAPPR